MLTAELREQIAAATTTYGNGATYGRVLRAAGTVIEACVPNASIGDLVRIERSSGDAAMGEVVGFHDNVALLMPFDDVTGISPGVRVRRHGVAADIGVGPALLGRMIDPFGVPLDGKPAPACTKRAPIQRPAPDPNDRLSINKPFETGVRIIDGLLTAGHGQRMGLFAGAGVGKTVLIRQIAQQSEADVKVIALIGERGCEVADMVEHFDLSSSVLVVATSDRSPLERARGALTATAIAEHFASEGANVMLVVDSLTRYAMALREVGLAAGELPATKGYPPSVFAMMPRLLERAAALRSGGSITAFYTVLVEGDDLSDPVADSARSLLDGHIVLSRDLAGRGHFPAIDVLASASRVMRQVASPEAVALADRTRAALAERRDVEDLRSLGAYQPGQNEAFDRALAVGERFDTWARQSPDESCDRQTALAQLEQVLAPPAPPATTANRGRRVKRQEVRGAQ
ncbi:MAG: FliI/YscN family ATPase [Nannocystaceae bacterium]|nr:FliI/YscN family ATPase [Nannocystaceae bacterium]